jgi:hypothetical protein
MQRCFAAWADPGQETHHSRFQRVLIGFPLRRSLRRGACRLQVGIYKAGIASYGCIRNAAGPLSQNMISFAIANVPGLSG